MFIIIYFNNKNIISHVSILLIKKYIKILPRHEKETMIPYFIDLKHFLVKLSTPPLIFFDPIKERLFGLKNHKTK